MKRKILNLRTSMAVILAGTLLFTNIKSGLSEINVNAATEKQTEYKVSSPRVEKTPGKQKVTYDIIEFGSYPQSEVTGEALTEEITEAAYDEYGDCTVGENKYRRMEIKENEGENDTEENAEYRYFKYEPLEWRVLKVSEGYAYMLSDRVIDAQWYDASHSSWNTSLIRYWLNGYKDMGLEIYDYPKSMLGTAFNEDEKKAMELYLQSAKLGNKIAISNVGHCYEKGIGVEINIDLAMEWYQKAIDEGYEPAKEKLEKLKKNDKKQKKSFSFFRRGK